VFDKKDFDLDKIRREAEESADRSMEKLEKFFQRNRETIVDVGAALALTFFGLTYLCFTALWSVGAGLLAALIRPEKADLVFYLAFWLTWVRFGGGSFFNLDREKPSFPLLVASYAVAVILAVALITEILLPKVVEFLPSLL